MTRLAKLAVLACTVIFLLAGVGCSTTKHVPDGKFLLDHVSIQVNDSTGKCDVGSSDLVNYLRQVPNHRVLGSMKLQLMTYSLSGRDSTKWYNRWLRRLGRPPVIYDDELTAASAHQLRQAMVNRGFMDVSVDVDTVRRDAKKKIDVRYTVTANEPHYISAIGYEIADTAVERLIMRDSTLFTVRPGDLFDRNRLDEERVLITDRLRGNGYYAFNKEYITFIADTSAMSNDVTLTMQVRPPRRGADWRDNTKENMHRIYRIRDIYFVTDYRPGEGMENFNFHASDTVRYQDITILYGADHYLKPQVLYENCFIERGDIYRTAQFDRTYEALGRLGILKSVNISLRPAGDFDGCTWMDAYVLLTRGKKQGVTFELEGTNSEGDLGFGVGLTYQHRNLAKGSELLTAKLRTSYESLSGNLDGLINDRYTEYAGEVGITLPKFKAPLLSRNFKRKVRATSEFAVSFNYQERPEYTRIIAGAGWKYKWGDRQNSVRRTFDLVDINYVYLPQRTVDFLNQIAPTNPLLRYSYEDHFIMRMGFTYYNTNKRIPATGVIRNTTLQPKIYTIRTAVESAGNLLYGISSAVGQHRSGGAYKIFGIQYAQYVKGEVDYMLARNFDSRSSLAFHVGFGVGVPYGNSRMLPFEKRFYAGGANGVRGWGVRTLGPGRYDSRNSVTDFINQCGDIRLDMNIEYRTKLFWVLEGAAFVDAGNVWTIHNYETQPGGMFRFNSFYKELAWAYGLGLRLDFTYFLLRFDLGMKAYNPALNQEAWPLIHPRWKRDSAFHFSVGYPF